MPEHLVKLVKEYEVVRLDSPNSFRTRLIAFLMRSAVKRGYVVVLVGKCRTGKTLLIEKARIPAVGGYSPVFQRKDLRFTRVPDGCFAIDEIRSFERKTFLGELEKLRGRGFVLVSQTHADILEYEIGNELRRNHRCVVLQLARPDDFSPPEPRRWTTDYHWTEEVGR